MKSLIEFETEQPFATRFLTQALKQGQIVNSYLFCGHDLVTMYRMILRLAQIINCTDRENQGESKATACGHCQHCRWIEDNAHPGVITITNMSYLHDLPEADDESGVSKSKITKAKKSIHVDQLNNLLRELGLHSGSFCRIVILAGAQEGPIPETPTLGFPPPPGYNPSEGQEFQLLPLDRKLFTDIHANKFLKTLEEPPPNVLFFLLTNSEEKLLETIVSRCQLIPFTTPKRLFDFELPATAQETFSQLHQLHRSGNFMNQARLLLTYATENGLSLPESITQYQNFLWLYLQRQPLEHPLFLLVRNNIRQLEQAKAMLKDKVREEAVLEDLFLRFNLPIKMA